MATQSRPPAGLIVLLIVWGLSYCAYALSVPAVFCWAFTLFALLIAIVAMLATLFQLGGIDIIGSIGDFIGRTFHLNGTYTSTIGGAALIHSILVWYAWASLIVFLGGKLLQRFTGINLQQKLFGSAKRWMLLVLGAYVMIILGFSLGPNSSTGSVIGGMLFFCVGTLLMTLLAFGAHKAAAWITEAITTLEPVNTSEKLE